MILIWNHYREKEIPENSVIYQKSNLNNTHTHTHTASYLQVWTGIPS